MSQKDACSITDDPLWVEILPASAAVSPDGAPPSFAVATGGAAFFAVEVTTRRELFEKISSRTKATFFNSFWGGPDASGRADVEARTDLKTAATSAGAQATATYALPKEVWQEMRASDAIYYRVLAATDRRLTGGVRYSVTDRNWQSAPFVHVLTRAVKARYETREKKGDLAPLAVDGNRLVGENGATVVLRGVNFSGLEHRKFDFGGLDGSHTTWEAAAYITPARAALIRKWGASVVRLCLNQEWYLHGLSSGGRTMTGPDYAAAVDRVIDLFAARGMYVILDLQALDRVEALEPSHLWNPPMPDGRSLPFFRMLASRYKGNPAVLYDLCNEPHVPEARSAAQKTIGERDLYVGRRLRKGADWVLLWKEWARRLEKEIHGVDPKAIVLVAGIGGPLRYASSLRSMPVERDGKPLPNTVYKIHIYRSKDGAQCLDAEESKRALENDDDWDYWTGSAALRKKVPVFVGEWGEELEAPDPRAWCERLRAWLAGRIAAGELAGWTAWALGAAPHVTKKDTSDALSPFGEVVLRALADDPARKPATAAPSSPSPSPSPTAPP